MGSYYDTLKAIGTMDEESEHLPEDLKRIQEIFYEERKKNFAPVKAKKRPVFDADVETHIMGARRAAREVGIFPALLSSAAHEVTGLFEDRGHEVSIPNRIRHFTMDTGNNLLGIYSAVRSSEKLSKEEKKKLLRRGINFWKDTAGTDQGELRGYPYLNR